MTLSRAVLRLAPALAASLALLPAAASAAQAPDPATMRASLAEPIDSSYVEAEVGTQGTLEGPFDANAYADYYRSFGTSEKELQAGLQILKRDGFAGGYGRQWYRPRTNDMLGELVMVFGGNAGASSSEQATRQRYAQDSGFQSFVDTGLGGSSFGAKIDSTTYDYRWTVIVFVKGNDLFAVSAGSQSADRTSEALAQARRAYDVAPASIALPGQSNAGQAILASARFALVLGLILILVIAAVVATVVVLVRPAPAQR